MVASDHYDHVISFGVLYYLENEKNAEQFLLEMLRIAKPGGMLYIGNSDNPEDKKTCKMGIFISFLI
jgi:ubiquinone/menaquinone biosynthesis C-methylase UbiE